MCHDAARLLSGSLGLFASQCDSRAAYWTPPRMITLVAPVPRTASTSSCIPAAWKVMPLQVPPSRLHRRRVRRSVEHAPALRAGVLRPRAVHPAQPDGPSGGVHQSGALYVHGGGAGRRGRGRGRRRGPAARGRGGAGAAPGERTERQQDHQANAHSANVIGRAAPAQAVVRARANDRTRNATTSCTTPTTSANHAISASTVVTVRRG